MTFATLRICLEGGLIVLSILVPVSLSIWLHFDLVQEPIPMTHGVPFLVLALVSRFHSRGKTYQPVHLFGIAGAGLD